MAARPVPAYERRPSPCKQLKAIHLLDPTACLFASIVFFRDSSAKDCSIGSTSAPNPKGTSRLSVIASHSTYTPPARSSMRQYEFIAHRNPLPSPSARSRSEGLPAFSTCRTDSLRDCMAILVGPNGT